MALNRPVKMSLGSGRNHCQAMRQNLNPMNDVKLWVGSTLVSILAFINPQSIIVFLSIVSTALTLIHNGVKAYPDIKRFVNRFRKKSSNPKS